MFKPTDPAASEPGPPAIAQALAQLLSALPSFAVIKARVPVFHAAGGGTIINRSTLAIAEIPMYRCNGCR